MMTETSLNVRKLPEQIINVLAANQHKEGLSVAEIKEGLGLSPTYNRKVNPKIYKAIGILMSRGEIRRWTPETNKKIGMYALAKPREVPVEPEPQGSPSECLAAIEEPNTDIHHLFRFLKAERNIFDGWDIVPSPQAFPSQPGIYAFFDRNTGECLYVGRAVDLQQRCRNHEKWQEAASSCEYLYAAYRVVDCVGRNAIKETLAHEEGLMIKLLCPRLNAGARLSGCGVAIDNRHLEQVELIHWTQFFSKHPQPFHPSMLTDEGYVVLKTIRSMVEPSKPQERVVRVLYDRHYARDWADDLANQVDIFFSIWEPRKQGCEPSEAVEVEDVKSGEIACIEVVITNSIKVNISIFKQ